MKCVIQRVGSAKVEVDGVEVGAITQGLLVLVGFETVDESSDVEWMTRKIVQMRIFSDEEGQMNKSVLDIDGQMLLVSQFTLHASTKKGNRPSFIKAARPEQAIPLYQTFKNALQFAMNKSIETGEFGANMQVSLCNDGPVTIVIDSRIRE